MGRGYGKGRGWLVTGWMVALVCGALGAISYRANLKLKTEVQSLRARISSQSAELDQARNTLNLMRSPAAMHVSLAAGVAQSKPQGSVIYSQEQGHLILIASKLRPLPDGKTYQMWLVPPRGSPVAVAAFSPDEDGNIALAEFHVPAGTKATAFVISVEEVRGAARPTMPLVMVGSARK